MRSWLQSWLLIISLAAPAALAQVPVPVGDEFQVNTYVTSSQFNPSVASTGAGDFVVVWSSSLQDGSSSGIFGQRFDSAGGRLGEEFQVNTYTDYDQFSSAVAFAPNGGFLVVWETFLGGDVQGIRGQRFDSAGVALGRELEVNSYSTTRQAHPDVTATPDGSFVVVWSSYQDGDRQSIHGQRYDSQGSALAGEFQVNSATTGAQRFPAVEASPDGGFVVAWESYLAAGPPQTSYHGVQAQRYDSQGSPLGGEFQVNTYTTALTYWPPDPNLAVDAEGRFVVVWTSYQDGFYSSVHGRRFDSSGSPAGDEFQINSYENFYQFAPDVAVDDAGDFTVVWTSYSQDGSDHSIQARRYASDGTPLGGELQINAATAGPQVGPALAMGKNSNFVVAWDGCHQAICVIPGFSVDTASIHMRGGVPPDDFRSIQARRFALDSIFADSFESGDASAWQ